MKRVEGQNLRDVMRDSETQCRSWRDDESALLGVFTKLGEAMAYAHSRSVVHRDLKPENIMVGEFGEVLVMDWGLAKPLGNGNNDNPRDHRDRRNHRHAPILTDRRTKANSGNGGGDDDGGGELTMQGEVFGTPSYMPPEQARGDHAAMDERADIFALGAILYALLALCPPYTGKNAVQILALARAGKFAPAERVAPSWRQVPKELAAIAAKAMAFSPADRYQNVRELMADIAAYQRFEPISARRDAPLVAVVKWMRRHPRIALGSALSVVFALIVGVLMVQLQAAQTHAELAQQSALIEAERADQQAALAAAETARAAAAERLAVAETARAADAEAVAQERQELLREMRAGDYQYVLSLLEAQVRGARDTALEEFSRLWRAAKSARKSDEQFVNELGAEKVDEYIAAFDRLFEQHEKRGITVTAEDYFYRGVLRNMGKRDHAGAIRDYDRAIQINPQLWEAWAMRGQTQIIGYIDRVAGIRDLQQAYRLCPDPAAKQQLAGYLRQHGGAVPE